MCLTQGGRPEFPARDNELLKSARSLSYQRKLRKHTQRTKQVLNKKIIIKELKRVTKEAYKQKIEPNVPCNNMKRVWKGTSLMSGHKGKKGSASGLCPATREYDDELNDFYCRIDTYDFSTERNSSTKTISIASKSQEEALTVTQSIYNSTLLPSVSIIALYSNVLWCQVHPSHVHASHETTLNHNNKNKHSGKMSLINKYTRNPTGILSCKHIFHFCDLNRLVDVMYSYVTHCADLLIPAKQNTVFPNNKLGLQRIRNVF